MNDIESFVFSPIAGRLRTEYSGIAVSGEYKGTPARFPSVTIEEVSNTVFRRMVTLKVENASSLMYEVNVFSDLTAGAKLQARDIMKVIDEEFASLRFRRTMLTPTPNLQDATIYRLTARYEGIVVPEYTPDGTIYRLYGQN